jgi:hypothetical protein
MGLKYKNIVKGAYVYSERTQTGKDQDAKCVGDSWYLHCLATMVNEGKISVDEFNNFFENSISD